MKLLPEPASFDWDKGNTDKNLKHSVSDKEAEEVFFDKQRQTSRDVFHSDKEERLIILGQTKQKRLLFVVFTIRNGQIRVISARDTNKRERRLYEEKTNNP